jgi:glycosyltransferase involved in cell wall biosynthesis
MPCRSDAPGAGHARRLLIICHDFPLAGGLLRFERAGAVLRSWGHEAAFLPLARAPRFQWAPSLPVLDLQAASSVGWDATMLPGAGFPTETLERLGAFADPRFGRRIQHILNDPSRRAKFENANARFAPDLVVFNNDHWKDAGLGTLKAGSFHTLTGAVDTRAFSPAAGGKHPLRPTGWVVGGLASKNPQPLVDALDLLPDDVAVRLFGRDRHRLAARHASLVDAGRLQLAGPLGGDGLPAFYREVDCIVMAETHAGWSNLSAEALASGVPLICTSAGTLAFARHEETALIMGVATAPAVADAIRRLRADDVLCRRLASKGRATIEPYSWEAYTKQLLELAAP